MSDVGFWRVVRRGLKIIRAIVAQCAGCATGLVQMVHMGQRLDQRQPVFAAPDGSLEQGRKALPSAAGSGRCVSNRSKAP